MSRTGTGTGKRARKEFEEPERRFWPLEENPLRVRSRDGYVIIYWDLDNCPFSLRYDCTDLSKRFLQALQTLDRHLKIEKIVCVGDLKARLSVDQRGILSTDRLFVLIDVPNVDRRKAAVKQSDDDKDLAARFLAENQSIMNMREAHRDSEDPIHTNRSHQHIAKYFLAKYFNLTTANGHLSEDGLQQHCRNIYFSSSPQERAGSHAGGPSQAHAGGPSQAHAAAQQPPQLHRSKTDLGDMKLLEKICTDVADHGPPGIIMMISADRDFASILSSLKRRGYTVLNASNKLWTLRGPTHAGWRWEYFREGQRYDYIDY